jgi:hypothetical protein
MKSEGNVVGGLGCSEHPGPRKDLSSLNQGNINYRTKQGTEKGGRNV